MCLLRVMAALKHRPRSAALFDSYDDRLGKGINDVYIAREMLIMRKISR
jgi:hypothetical protein